MTSGRRRGGRRRILSSAAVGGGTLVAGCPDRGGGNDGGDGTPAETPTGAWELRARVGNEDDRPREWRVECRSPTGSTASASGTVPAGDAVEVGLAGLVRDEQLDVAVDSDAGGGSRPWRATECRELFVDSTIVDGSPQMDPECSVED